MNAPDSMSDPPAAIPWYRSKVYIGAATTVVSTLLSLSPKAAKALGVQNTEQIGAMVEAVFGVIALISGAYTAQARANSPLQPLTLTQKSADAKTAAITATNTDQPLQK